MHVHNSDVTSGTKLWHCQKFLVLHHFQQKACHSLQQDRKEKNKNKKRKVKLRYLRVLEAYARWSDSMGSMNLNHFNNPKQTYSVAPSSDATWVSQWSHTVKQSFTLTPQCVCINALHAAHTDCLRAVKTTGSAICRTKNPIPPEQWKRSPVEELPS